MTALSFEMQLWIFGLLFVIGTVGYMVISSKLKDPRKIYADLPKQEVKK